MSQKTFEIYAATRSDGCVGYFETLENVPTEFKYPGKEDITNLVKSLGAGNLQTCLQIMNSHWKH